MSTPTPDSKGDIEVRQRFWRRPLGATADSFADAGFAIERVAEPQPSAEAVERYPAELSDHVGDPIFIVYRLRLTGR